MASRKIWTKRVDRWRASGLSSTQYCAGRSYTACALRHWAHRLSHSSAPVVSADIRVAKVVRVDAADMPVQPRSEHDPPCLVVELGAARLLVPVGADRQTLGMVLGLLMTHEAVS